MKKIFAFLSLFASAAAFASAGVTTEFEGEYGRGKDSGTNGSSVAIAPYVKFGDGWKADIKFEGSRDFGQVSGENKAIEGLTEARIRKDFKVTDKASVGLRVGIGEKYSTKDFSYYTFEPIIGYKLSEPLSVNASVRYRNAFNSANEYQTRTYKLGTAYKITKEDEVGVKYFEKYGDSRSHGFELVYTRGF